MSNTFFQGGRKIVQEGFDPIAPPLITGLRGSHNKFLRTLHNRVYHFAILGETFDLSRHLPSALVARLKLTEFNGGAEHCLREESPAFKKIYSDYPCFHIHSIMVGYCKEVQYQSWLWLKWMCFLFVHRLCGSTEENYLRYFSFQCIRCIAWHFKKDCVFPATWFFRLKLFLVVHVFLFSVKRIHYDNYIIMGASRGAKRVFTPENWD